MRVWFLALGARGFSRVFTEKEYAPTPRFAEETQNKIYQRFGIQSRQIEVQAANGVVTLTGDVNNDSERAAAASDAATVEGVKTVVNNLQVQQAQAAPPAERRCHAKRKQASLSQPDEQLRPEQGGRQTKRPTSSRWRRSRR